MTISDRRRRNTQQIEVFPSIRADLKKGKKEILPEVMWDQLGKFGGYVYINPCMRMELSYRTLSVALFSFRDNEEHTGYMKLGTYLLDTQFPFRSLPASLHGEQAHPYDQFCTSLLRCTTSQPISPSVSATRCQVRTLRK